MERILLTNLTVTTKSNEFPFAYKPRRGTTDAVLCQTVKMIMHVDKKEPGNYTRCVFIDFPIAFNTSAIMEKGGDPDVIDWISLHQGSSMYMETRLTSEIRFTHTGTPQGLCDKPFSFDNLYP